MPTAGGMSWLTLLLLLYLAWGALSGWRRGLILVASSLIGYVGGYFLAIRYQQPLQTWVLQYVPLRQWVTSVIPPGTPSPAAAETAALHLAQSLLGILVFVLVVGLAEFAARTIGLAITRLVGVLPLTGLLNAVGGMAAGVLEHAVLAAVVFTLLLSFAPLAHSGLAGAVRSNTLASGLTAWANQLQGVAHSLGGGSLP
ncbi:MAG: CvpA family protein [Firmicutes bacterium]|nr:CvpA family protein [Bacillota bacterium]